MVVSQLLRHCNCRYCRGDILLVRSSWHPFGLTSFMCRFIALVLVTVVHVSFMYLHHYTATVTTFFKHGAPLLRLFVAPEVVNRLLLCNDMVVRSTTLVRYNNSLERWNEMTGKASFSQTMDQKFPKDNIEIELGIKIPW